MNATGKLFLTVDYCYKNEAFLVKKIKNLASSRNKIYTWSYCLHNILQKQVNKNFFFIFQLFKAGRGFYEFTKPETISSKKEVVLIDKYVGNTQIRIKIKYKID